MNCSPPDSSVHGISQARIMEGVAILFSRGSLQPRDRACKADSLLLSQLGSPTLSLVLCLVDRSCPTLCNPMDCSPPGSSVHGDSPGKIIGVVSLSLLQGIFLTQELNLGLLHCRQILYQMSHQGSPPYSPHLSIRGLIITSVFQAGCKQEKGEGPKEPKIRTRGISKRVNPV